MALGDFSRFVPRLLQAPVTPRPISPRCLAPGSFCGTRPLAYFYEPMLSVYPSNYWHPWPRQLSWHQAPNGLTGIQALCLPQHQLLPMVSGGSSKPRLLAHPYWLAFMTLVTPMVPGSQKSPENLSPQPIQVPAGSINHRHLLQAQEAPTSSSNFHGMRLLVASYELRLSVYLSTRWFQWPQVALASGRLQQTQAPSQPRVGWLPWSK